MNLKDFLEYSGHALIGSFATHYFASVGILTNEKKDKVQT